MAGVQRVLLICTVGGSPEPIVASIKHWRPSRIRFVHSPQTKQEVINNILSALREEGVQLDLGQCDFTELTDGQDFRGCIDKLGELTSVVEEWVARGEGYQVVVDFTGGTKCMSAALALQARRWPCAFSYVGGERRDKGGVGVVVSGTEKVVDCVNPWDALGQQAKEEFVTLFDQYAFSAAARLAEEIKKKVSEGHRKREFNALEQLARAYELWERFNHKKAINCLREVTRARNDLRAVLGQRKAEHVLEEIERHVENHLSVLENSSLPTRNHVVDLLANARRRREEGRYDDGVARLYRAIEATAQLRLAEQYGIDTARVALDRVPEDLRGRLAARAKDGLVQLGLQDNYAVLSALGDPLGEKFRRRELHERESPLNARNNSILAHGFEPMSENVFQNLWEVALDLADVKEEHLPKFPRLSAAV